MPEGVRVEVEGWGSSSWGGEKLHSEKHWQAEELGCCLDGLFQVSRFCSQGLGTVGRHTPGHLTITDVRGATLPQGRIWPRLGQGWARPPSLSHTAAPCPGLLLAFDLAHDLISPDTSLRGLDRPLCFSLLKGKLGRSIFKGQGTSQHKVPLKNPSRITSEEIVNWLKKLSTVNLVFFLITGQHWDRKTKISCSKVHRLYCYESIVGRIFFFFLFNQSVVFKCLCLTWLLDNHPTFDGVITR